MKTVFLWLLMIGMVRLSCAQTPGIIRTTVEYKLIQERILKNDDVTVTIQDGVVTLRGRVENAAQLKRAEKVAAGVAGVRSVRNELRVDTAGDVPDARIAEAIAASIRGSVWFDMFDWVEGEVKDGRVTLRGAVREPWRRAEFGRLAESVKGVAQVDNRIVALPLSPYDDSLRVNIAQGIYGHPSFVRYANRSLPPIHIVVENGKVSLKGSVATSLERQLAETIANQTDALGVTNDLTIDLK